METLTPLAIDIWSDVVCPWCWVGKRRLEHALVQEAAEAAASGQALPAVQLRLRAFELRPDMPVEGADARTFYARLFGGAERYDQIAAKMRGVGEEVGIDFDYPAIRRAANTRLAHRAIAIADGVGAAGPVMEALHRAYFSEGRDVGDLETVVGVVVASGAVEDTGALRDRLLAGEGAERVESDEQMARQLGITGVPMFVVGLESGGQPVGVSGAQPVEVMRRLLEIAREQAATPAG
jgi:predicted DsbA family dithiol-disulfide isomerase